MPDSKEAIREKLAQTRQELLSFLRPLTKEQWEAIVHEEPEPWTVADMLRHIAGAERGMTDLIRNIQGGGKGASPEFDVSRYNRSVVSKGRAKMPSELLDVMDNNRTNLLQLLGTLSEEDLKKKGRHGTQGILSIEEIFILIADHERSHVDQIRQALELEAASGQ